MDNLATIRMELGINAQRIISHFQTNNKNLEEAVTKGIERALNEIIADDNFEQVVANATKNAINETVFKAANEWTVQHKIQDAVSKAIEAKVTQIAAGWADKITRNLKAL